MCEASVLVGDDVCEVAVRVVAPTMVRTALFFAISEALAETTTGASLSLMASLT